MSEPGWTLDELVRRASEALAAGQVHAPDGRVTALPDRRVVRWYATIGLVDRPGGYRGRTALYGPRHLLQVVAVKRRQAQGRSLAQIQAELAGATDATLSRVARVPSSLLAAEPPVNGRRAAPRFWARPSATSASTPPAPADQEIADQEIADQGVADQGIADQGIADQGIADQGIADQGIADQGIADQGIAVPPDGGPAQQPHLLYAVPLDTGAALILRARPGPDDLVAMRAAARPLLDLLAQRDLLGADPGPEGA